MVLKGVVGKTASFAASLGTFPEEQRHKNIGELG
jgi:hypothetical protein